MKWYTILADAITFTDWFSFNIAQLNCWRTNSISLISFIPLNVLHSSLHSETQQDERFVFIVTIPELFFSVWNVRHAKPNPNFIFTKQTKSVCLRILGKTRKLVNVQNWNISVYQIFYVGSKARICSSSSYNSLACIIEITLWSMKIFGDHWPISAKASKTNVLNALSISITSLPFLIPHCTISLSQLVYSGKCKYANEFSSSLLAISYPPNLWLINHKWLIAQLKECSLFSAHYFLCLNKERRYGADC